MSEELSLFSEEEASSITDSISINLQKTLHVVVFVDIYGHKYYYENKASNSKLSLSKFDVQSWSIPNPYINALIDAEFLIAKKKTSKNITLSVNGKIIPNRQEVYETLKTRFGTGPFHIFEDTNAGARRILDVVQKRSTPREWCLLRSSYATNTPDWFMHVPKCFNAALDMQLLERRKNQIPFLMWTQGNNFGFSQGDIIYRNPYTGSSNAPLLQIDSASSAGPGESGKRSPGHVRFTWHFTGDDTTREMTQDEFVRLLISGE